MVDRRFVAIIVLILTWVFFAYYTVWILVTPLLDDDIWMQDYFPDRMYGIMPTSLLAYLILAYVFTFSGIALISADRNKSPLESDSPTSMGYPANKDPLGMSTWQWCRAAIIQNMLLLENIRPAET